MTAKELVQARAMMRSALYDRLEEALDLASQTEPTNKRARERHWKKLRSAADDISVLVRSIEILNR